MERQDYIDALKTLKLSTMAEAFDDVVIDGVRRKRPTLDILEKLLNAEITQRQINQTEARVKRGRFPQQRHFSDFNFAHSTLDQAHLDLLIVGDYVKQKKNILFVGGPGTGKTHLATALGLHAATQGYKVRFWNVLELVNQLELDSDSKNYKLRGLRANGTKTYAKNITYCYKIKLFMICSKTKTSIKRL
ncbi:ATP-binding protein [Proteus mirabilis]|nr:ATP-binding protein [Proteus mirabilis]